MKNDKEIRKMLKNMAQQVQQTGTISIGGEDDDEEPEQKKFKTNEMFD